MIKNNNYIKSISNKKNIVKVTKLNTYNLDT